MKSNLFSTIALAACFLVVPFAHGAVEDEDCGNLTNAFGPFDYRSAAKANIEVVETHHFTPKVESLISGQEGRLEADISYTLRAFPNHHRALLAMARLMLREKKTKLPFSPYSIECWFRRASLYQPDDGQVRVIHGYYLSKAGNLKGAVDEFQDAIKLGEDTGNVHYNLGLVLFELKDFEGSLANAKKAYALGFQLPGLRNKLREAGIWKDE